MFPRIIEHKNKDGSVRRYLYLVESYRDKEGRVRQKVVCLGRVEELREEGKIERLVEKLVEICELEGWVNVEKGLLGEWSKAWGPVYVFRRLWKESGLKEIIKEIKGRYKIEFDIEEAIFEMVLNRLVNPESKRGTFLRWREKYWWGEKEKEIGLHHYYRALDMLAKEMEGIEERLYWRGRDLLEKEPYLALFDTTRVHFEGEGPEELAEYGYSRRYPDKKQIIVGVVMREEGLPIMEKVFPGNKVDKESFREAVKELRERFKIRRAIMVADQGCVDGKVIEEMEKEGMEYIVGVKMRKLKEGREALRRRGRYSRVEEKLWVKEVRIGEKRYIVVKNPQEAEREKKVREEVLESLKEKLKSNPKSLVGNRKYRKFLKVEKGMVKIDERKIKEEERYDGKWVILTNTGIEKDKVARYYKDLWRVERVFQELKDVLEVRPVWHWKRERVLGHIGICFLALYLESFLFLRLEEKRGIREIISELEKLSVVKLRREGKKRSYLLRTEIPSSLCKVFRKLGIGFPPRILSCNDTSPS